MPLLYRQLQRRFAPRRDGLTRREMLQATLAASAGLLLSSHALAQNRPGRRIVVVGGGFSGLATAFELKSAGYDVLVLEARNRVGGRVITFRDFVPGKHVEGGGELVGSNHPTWVAYAERFKLSFLDVTEEEDFDFPMTLGGKPLSSDEAGKIWEELDEAVNQMNADAAKVTDPHQAWLTPNAEALDKKTLASWIASMKASPTCKLAMDAMMSGDNGVRSEWQSYLGNLAMVQGGGGEKYWTDSEIYRCAQGNQALATKLAAEIGADRIRLQTIVKRIDHGTQGVRITLASGEMVGADDVVLAIPPSTWNRIGIEPALPAALAPQMGSNVKYLISLRNAFWRRAKVAPDSLSDGPINWTWHQTDGQKGVPVSMCAFSGGVAAETVREWTPAQRRTNYLRELGKSYPGIGAAFVNDRFMNWPSDAWTRAGYSFPAPGQVTTVGPLLRKGVDRVHFAGEHASYAFVGFMEGALNSGASLAKRLAQRDGISKVVARKGATIIELMIVGAILFIIGSIFFGSRSRSGGGSQTEAPAEDAAAAEARAIMTRLEGRLAPPPDTTWRDGLAAVVLVDVSGSMQDRIKGERRRKIEAAQQATTDLVSAFARYAATHKDQTVQVGVYEFSARNNEPAARQVVPIGPPNPATASDAIQGMKARGGTPIGDAMVEARLALDRTGLTKRHLLVVTDGENTDGLDPALVARALERQKDGVRASLYFVAFDVDAQAFAGVKQAGGMLLSAKSGPELAATIDELLSDRILVEAPRETVEKPRSPVEAAPPR